MTFLTAGRGPILTAESPFPSSINVADGPDGLEDDGDLSLLLYVGAENARHRLCDARSSYKDLSGIGFAEMAVVCNNPARRDPFPVILHSIVSNGWHRDSIQWLWHGRAFQIVNANKFFAVIAPLYVCPPDPALFLERAAANGFRRIGCRDKSGAKRIVFYHEVRRCTCTRSPNRPTIESGKCSRTSSGVPPSAKSWCPFLPCGSTRSSCGMRRFDANAEKPVNRDIASDALQGDTFSCRSLCCAAAI